MCSKGQHRFICTSGFYKRACFSAGLEKTRIYLNHPCGTVASIVSSGPQIFRKAKEPLPKYRHWKDGVKQVTY